MAPRLVAATLVLVLVFGHSARSQQGGPGGFGPPGGNGFNAANPGGQPGAGLGFGDSNAQGASSTADFDSLIELIVSTVATDTWAENGGGEAEIRPFPTGVWVDPAGVLQTIQTRTVSSSPRQVRLDTYETTDLDPRATTELRCVSLTRLEAEIARRMHGQEPLDESMLALAGLRRVERVFVYPETQEIVLAGPAGDWTVDDERRLVAADTRIAIPRLDDLLVLLRREQARPGAPFGCAITPRQDSLAATQKYLDDSSAKPLPPGRESRERWVEGMGDRLGRQDIEVFGVDPATNVARVLVEADHHMKRVGLGVTPGVTGLDDYMDRAAALRQREALSVLRWWFAMRYDSVQRSADGLAYYVTGQAVRVLSENELLTERGERVHTGVSDSPTRGFAADFTERFDDLCEAHPVYGELRNVFDLALVAALLERQGLWSLAGAHSALFLDAERLPLPRHRVASEVDTLVTHRVLRGREVLAAASGGVWATPKAYAESTSTSGSLTRPAAPPLTEGLWWWDAE